MLRVLTILMFAVLALHAQTHKVVFDLQTGDGSTLPSKLIGNVELFIKHREPKG